MAYKGNQYEFRKHPKIKWLRREARTPNLWIAGPLLNQLSLSNQFSDAVIAYMLHALL